MNKLTDIELAQIFYEAYGDKANWKTYNNTDMNTWTDVREDIKDKWIAVAIKARELLNKNISIIEFGGDYSYIKYLANYFKTNIASFDEDLTQSKLLEFRRELDTNALLMFNSEKKGSIVAIVKNEDDLDNYTNYNCIYIDKTLPRLLHYYNLELNEQELVNLYNNYFMIK